MALLKISFGLCCFVAGLNFGLALAAIAVGRRDHAVFPFAAGAVVLLSLALI